jgi:hypothetical protein
MSGSKKHPDPVVRDLRAIRGLRWSQPEKFRSLEVLLSHPAVYQNAANPKGVPERVKALERLLRWTRTDIKRKENNSAPLNRSVAAAGAALLRLDPEFEDMDVADIHRHVAGEWQKKNGGHLKPDTFRLHYEDPKVYEPFAEAFERFVVARAERLGIDLSEWSDRAEGSSAADARTKQGRLHGELRKMELESHRRRLLAIDEGTLRIRDEEEMGKVLLVLTRLAEISLYAVDYNPVGDWFKDPLDDYLAAQLKRADEGSIELERIRLVEENELDDAEVQQRLRDLLELHTNSSATLLLCPVKAARKLEISFERYKGLLLVDDDSEPLAVTGKIGDGSVGRALVYTHETDEVGALREEYTQLRRVAKAHDHRLKQALAEGA